jgi:FixJ family two-component response regulator
MAPRPVYLIDDDEATLESTKFLLDALNIEARTFSDPFEFLHAVASLPPGCVLTDLRMPAMSGLELHAALARKRIRWPVVLMSGHSAIESNKDALDRGIFAMIEKPFTRDGLVEILDRASAAMTATASAGEEPPAG